MTRVKERHLTGSWPLWQAVCVNTSEAPPPGDRRVCADCIGERYLADLIDRTGLLAMCHYCSVEGQTIAIEELSERVEHVIDQHFERTATDPEGYEYYIQRETGNWERSGEPVAEVIAEMLEADGSIADDLREVLDEKTSDWDGITCGEEQPFSDEAHYVESTSVDHASISEEYQRFEQVLVDQARYFSPETRSFLGTLFGQLAGLRTHDGRPALVDAGPEQAISGFFRARVFQDDERLKRALSAPDRELGPPPPRLGRAGRLNAAGVSIFYGADTEDVALAEVRPPVGSRVVMAQFELLRPVRLLDIDALKSLLVEGSLFDLGHADRLQHAAFLRSFSWRFTQPVMPDHEAFEYIPTQAVADYLANEVEPPLDGILYASPQSALTGKNVALFHRSSRVERRVSPEGMTTNVWFGHHTDEGDEVDYTVFELVPPPAQAPVQQQVSRLPTLFGEEDPPIDQDTRMPTLRINIDNMHVLHIHAVQVRSESYPVSRSRHERNRQHF